MTTFGRTIARLRQQRGLSQRQLAEVLGITPMYLNDIEHDRRLAPPSARLGDFAEALQVPYDYLMVLAGRLPEDISVWHLSPAEVKAAIDELRGALT